MRRHHVARVLFVAGCVRDDEFASLSCEESVGNVDRDALFAARGEPVDQQREIDVLSLCAEALAVVRQSRELVLKDHFAVVEQAADQRRFAVIDEPQVMKRSSGLVRIDGSAGHQKYPACFLSSIEAAWS